ncbi:hypothetical protein GBAR_LOCUS21736, partial [Geodia barretti]
TLLPSSSTQNTASLKSALSQVKWGALWRKPTTTLFIPAGTQSSVTDAYRVDWR